MIALTINHLPKIIRKTRFNTILIPNASPTTHRRCLIFPSPARMPKLIEDRQENIKAGDARCNIYPENLKFSPKRNTAISCPKTTKKVAITIARIPK